MSPLKHTSTHFKTVSALLVCLKDFFFKIFFYFGICFQFWIIVKFISAACHHSQIFKCVKVSVGTFKFNDVIIVLNQFV